MVSGEGVSGERGVCHPERSEGFRVSTYRLMVIG